MRTTTTTTLLDDAGEPHEYTCTPHPALEGMQLGIELFGLLGESLDVSKGLSTSFGGLSAGLLKRGGPKLVVRLLQHCARDGARLEKDADFQVAYQANYGELIRACDWVIKVNFSGFSSAAEDLVLRRLLDFLQPRESGSNGLLAGILKSISGSGDSSAQEPEPSSKSSETGASTTS